MAMSAIRGIMLFVKYKFTVNCFCLTCTFLSEILDQSGWARPNTLNLAIPPSEKHNMTNLENKISASVITAEKYTGTSKMTAWTSLEEPCYSSETGIA